jgi:general secretion pathway protein G
MIIPLKIVGKQTGLAFVPRRKIKLAMPVPPSPTLPRRERGRTNRYAILTLKVSRRTEPTYVKIEPGTSGGFSLIELLITLAIMAVLVVLVMPMAQIELQRSREQDLRRALWEIRHSIDEYKKASSEKIIPLKAGSSGYPESLDILVQGVPNQRDPKHTKLFFLRRIPRDPMQINAALSDEHSWGLRSYASEANDPREGSDIYDVYSTSPKVGLNGIPYSKW